MVKFGTKAETLERLEPLVSSARILPQVRCEAGDWKNNPDKFLSDIHARNWMTSALIVRSSGVQEDQLGESMAGRYTSVPNVVDEAALRSAIEDVITSFGDTPDDSNQIFVQPYLTDVAFSGVAFTREPGGGGHYFVINYNDTDGRTDSVEAGQTDELKTLYIHKGENSCAIEKLNSTLTLLHELESVFGDCPLDVEFTGTDDGELYLLQVRPLNLKRQPVANVKDQGQLLTEITEKVRKASRPHPYLHGSKSIFGVMPDWNPAEIIGIRPRPLSLSLYKDLVTDSIWAYQRNNYGYKNLRSFPLLINLGGIPYIDVRVSFNSFLPRHIPDELAERLADHYISRLIAEPNLHDKVEFEIIHSCLTLDMSERLNDLHASGFSESDITTLIDHLRPLTNRAIHGTTGLWRDDIAKISELKKRQQTIEESSLDPISKIYWLLEDCKRYGTLPFAGLARAGFMAMQMLNSLVTKSILSDDDRTAFLAHLQTVTTDISHDLIDLSKQEFLSKYGFLRPGTYDICSLRYDEAPDEYFDWSQVKDKEHTPKQFSLTLDQLNSCDKLLADVGIEHTSLGFFEFIKSAIEGREYAKFAFTKSISDSLSLFSDFVEDLGFSRDDASYASLSVIKDLYESSTDPVSALRRSIESGRELYELNQQVCLPQLIVEPSDTMSFEVTNNDPNFVTRKNTIGHVWRYGVDEGTVDDKIVFLPNADPGFDWIFTRRIRGFVTQYGGVNSHMAIRSNELGVPAVVGAGEQLYKRWSAATKLEIDCNNKIVRELL